MCTRIRTWKEKHPEGKLAVFGHADAVGATEYNLPAAEMLEGKACKRPGCKGTWKKRKTANWDGIPLPAVGVSMGGTWLFTSGDHSVWAHEIGHIRHLEHSPSQPGSTDMAPGGHIRRRAPIKM